MAATYVYAIVPSEDRVIFDEVGGVDEDRDEVYSVPYDGLAAVVSASPLADYRGLKRNEAALYLVAHQRVVEAAMQAFPVLPVRFGTVLPDEVWVRRLLSQGRTLFHTALERFAGLVQMEVVVLWNLQEVFQEISQEESIVEIKAQVADRPPEETMMERIAIGQMVQASLLRRRASLQARLLPPLRELSEDMAINPLMDDSMVANAGLLVNDAGREALDHRLALLDEEFGGQLLFRCVGPLPPYSFATVEVQLPSFEAVDQARCQLGLGVRVGTGEIRRAYYRLASQLHPDHNPGDPEAEARMAQLTQAYRLLMSYAGSQTLPRGAGDGQRPTAAVVGQQSAVVFSRDAAERTLLIGIERQAADGR